MTDADDGPATQADLQTELQSVLQRAHANGVNVEGGWACQNGDGHPDWDVVVTEVVPQIDSK